MDDSDLKQGFVVVLDNDEILFWEEFILKYLKLFYIDKEYEEQVFGLLMILLVYLKKYF